MTKIGIVIWEGAEPLDFTGPYEVFNNAAEFVEDEMITVNIIAERKEPVNAQGLQIIPDYSFESTPPLDIVLFPGGGVKSAIDNTEVVKWLKQQVPTVEHILSVCTGVFILAKGEILDGAKVTTHINSIKKLQEYEEEFGYNVVPNHRYHDNGKIVTSAGISAGIDMALHIVEKYWGEQKATEVANYMEYYWRKDDIHR